MYESHPLVDTPPDETKLWRYLDLSRFLGLLSQKSLYFATLGEFVEDKWEGTLPEGTIEGLKRFQENFSKKHAYGGQPATEDDDQVAVRRLKSFLKALQPMHVVNCWHRNDVESVAMWKLYTKGTDGVAIQTTVGHLKTCLSHERRPIHIARVKLSSLI